MEHELLVRLAHLDADIWTEDRSERVASVGVDRAVIVRLIAARVRHSMKRSGLGTPNLARVMLVHIAVNQLAMLGAAAVLDQEHVAAARTL